MADDVTQPQVSTAALRASVRIRHALKLIAAIRVAAERGDRGEAVSARASLEHTFGEVERAVAEHTHDRVACERDYIEAVKRERFIKKQLGHAQALATSAIATAREHGVELTPMEQ